MAIRGLLFAVVILALHSNLSFAQGKAKLAKETAEYVLGKFGKEAGQESVETLTRKIETLAVKHGDDALIAVKKVGPRSFHLVEEAGEHGVQSVKLMAKYGDDAVWVVAKQNRLAIFVKYGDDAAEAMMKHGEIAEPLLTTLGKPAAGALKTQGGRRLAMMAEQGELTRIGRTPELLDVIAKYGDGAMDFIWKHKGPLALSAALTAFLANPKPFIDGTADIAKVVAENVARPIAMNTNWTLVFIAIVVVFGGPIAFKVWAKRRRG